MQIGTAEPARLAADVVLDLAGKARLTKAA
jgi:hypothetical protein